MYVKNKNIKLMKEEKISEDILGDSLQEIIFALKLVIKFLS